MGLDEITYGSVNSNILSRNPLPTIDEVYQILVQDEDSKGAARVLEERHETMAFAAQLPSRPQSFVSREERQKMLCTSCGRKGHLAENFFSTLGYPSWWGDRPRSKPAMSRGRSSNSSQGRGSGRGFEMARANVLTTQVTPGASANTIITEKDRVGLMGLSDTQWKTLVNLLNEQKDSAPVKLSGMCPSLTWIISRVTQDRGFC